MRAVDCSDLIASLCERLAVPYERIQSIGLSPTTATVTLYLQNEKGNFYIINTDGEPAAGTFREAADPRPTGPATLTVEIPIRTVPITTIQEDRT